MEPLLKFDLNQNKDVLKATLTYEKDGVKKEKEYIFFKNTDEFLRQVLEYFIMENIPIGNFKL